MYPRVRNYGTTVTLLIDCTGPRVKVAVHKSHNLLCVLRFKSSLTSFVLFLPGSKRMYDFGKEKRSRVGSQSREKKKKAQTNFLQLFDKTFGTE